MRPLLFLTLATLTTFVRAAEYTLEVREKDAVVGIKVEKPSEEFRMPAWIPGDYELFDYGRRLSDVRFYKGAKEVPSIRGDDVNLWTVPGGADRVRYVVSPSMGNFSPNLQIRANEVFVNGGGVFGWFEGHAHEPVKLHLPAKPWTPMDVTGTTVQARDYDHLIDSPIVIGPDVKVANGIVHNRTHRVVGFGRNQNVDMDRFLETGMAAADQAFRLFGELPYKSYTFFLDFGGRGGGLEHADSTRIGLFPSSDAKRSYGILFHEYFHCFNVKRIRAACLGPFDYTKPATTSTLWWLEGVTDYYASKLATRAGLMTRDQFLGEIGSGAESVSRGAYLKVSAETASLRVWEGKGSFGFGGASYYEKGNAVGAFLDLAILGRTGGKKSLDDVVRALYKETKPPKPGYQDGRIRELCVQIGGDDLGPLYDAAVKTASPLPWDSVLPQVGLKKEGRTVQADVLASDAASKVLQNWP
ncbi:MAG: M61 family metallopeptidase [Armatimonadetes bacterium]|nr:M61 family metallopeptidase [Armatimonadota bacterium]